MKLRQTSTCGYETLIPDISGIFILCFLSAVLFYALMPCLFCICRLSMWVTLPGARFLIVDLRISCDDSIYASYYTAGVVDSIYASYYTAGIVAICMYPLGVPLLLFIVMWLNKDLLHVDPHDEDRVKVLKGLLDRAGEHTLGEAYGDALKMAKAKLLLSTIEDTLLQQHHTRPYMGKFCACFQSSPLGCKCHLCQASCIMHITPWHSFGKQLKWHRSFFWQVQLHCQ